MAQLQDTGITGSLSVTGGITGSLSGTATTASVLTNMNISQFTNDAGYSTSGNLSSAPFTLISASTELSLEENIAVDATNSNVSLELPNAENKKYFIKKIDSSANTVFINAPFYLYTQQEFFTSSYPSSGDDFGRGFAPNGVSLNEIGDVLLIGAPNDEAPSLSNSGLGFVFKKNDSSWTLDAILTGSYAVQSSDNFGNAVSIDAAGTLAVIGAQNDEIAVTSQGLAYVFRSSSAGWYEEIALTGSYAIDTSDALGRSISVSKDGSLIAVGAFQDEISPNASSSGVVYLFRSSSVGWYEEKFITGSYATNASDGFGSVVDVNYDGTKVIVGAPADEISLSFPSTGVAYLFESSSNGWTQTQFFTGSYAGNSYDQFGASVSIAPNSNIVAVGVPGDEFPGSAGSSGVAYVFRSGSSGWYEEVALSGSQAQQSADNFGKKVTLNNSGTLLFVTAEFDEEPGATVSERGLCYVFYSSSLGWKEKQYFSSSITFGNASNVERIDSHAINGDGTVVATGVRYADVTVANDAGIVYLFTSSAPNPATLDGEDSFVLTRENEAVTVVSDQDSYYYVQSSHNRPVTVTDLEANTISQIKQTFININGSYGLLSASDGIWILSASNNGDVTLPSAIDNKGLNVTIMRIDDNSSATVTVYPSGSETIGIGGTSKTVMWGMSGQYGFLKLVSLGEYGWGTI